MAIFLIMKDISAKAIYNISILGLNIVFIDIFPEIFMFYYRRREHPVLESGTTSRTLCASVVDVNLTIFKRKFVHHVVSHPQGREVVSILVLIYVMFSHDDLGLLN